MGKVGTLIRMTVFVFAFHSIFVVSLSALVFLFAIVFLFVLLKLHIVYLYLPFVACCTVFS